MAYQDDKIIALKRKYPDFYKKYGIAERRKKNALVSKIHRFTNRFLPAALLAVFILLLVTGFTYVSYEEKRPLNLEYMPAPRLTTSKESEINQRVSEVNIEEFRSYQELTEYLVQPYVDDIDRFYSIYRWVTSNIAYDIDSFRDDHITIEETYPDTVFKRRVAVCSGYSALLSAMASHAGIDIRVVEGQAYDSSGNVNPIIAGNNGHAWNIVKIKGYWYPVDSTWDAGSVNDDLTRFEKNTGKYEYFLADPDEFYVEHNASRPNMNLLNDLEMNTIDLIWHNLLEENSIN